MTLIRQTKRIMQLWYANAHADPDSETPDHSACMRALRIRI